MKIESIVKVKIGEYIINGTLHLKINEDSSLTISYDKTEMSEEQAKELIAEFFEI